jgi:hypothetical protein
VATLKGKTSEDELFEVLWQKEDATSMLPAIALGNAASREKQRVRRLRVRFQGEEIVVDDSRTEHRDRPRRGERHRRQGQPDLPAACAHRVQPQQVPADRPEHERHVRHDPRRRRGVRPPRQHAAERRGLDRVSGRVPESGSALTVKYVCEE